MVSKKFNQKHSSDIRQWVSPGKKKWCEHFAFIFHNTMQEFLCSISVPPNYTVMSVLGRFYVTQLHFGKVWHPT